nr:hypothetical protein [Candidatus Freyarchaeota archaeon]
MSTCKPAAGLKTPERVGLRMPTLRIRMLYMKIHILRNGTPPLSTSFLWNPQLVPQHCEL